MDLLGWLGRRCRKPQWGSWMRGRILPARPLSASFLPRWTTDLPNEEQATLPEHLEEIVAGSHPSLGDSGRQLLRDLLYRYRHVFPAPGEPVTGRTTSVQHEILKSDARPIHCGPRRLAPADWHRPGFGRNRHVFKKCYAGARSSQVITHGLPR